ncbi:MAG: extracellular solute-binding protein [Chloroflexi bacterium]|nr:extracellular solute-binding protein [Chloroflexota bacterium]
MPDRELRDPRATRSLSRRGFLKAALGTTSLLLMSTSVAATVAEAATGPVSGPVTAPFAPKQTNLSGTKLSYLGWASFIPTADAFVKQQIQQGFATETGAEVSVEFVNANDIQPKLSASIQTGAGPDIVHIRDNWAQTYIQSMTDVSDVVHDLQQTYGQFYPIFANNDSVGGSWYAMPHDNSGGAYHWRQSMFGEVGYSNFPTTYDDLFAAGKALKDTGRPLGQAFGHSFGDPPGWCYSMLWNYGGREVDEQGRVAINSAETISALNTMKQAYLDAFDETGLAWDDGSNNRAFLAETVSATLNGSSIWFVARNDNMPFFDDIGLANIPSGPKDHALLLGTDHYVIPKYSQNVDAAKELLRYLMRPDVYTPRFLENQSYIAGISPQHDAMLPWDQLPPAVSVFRDLGPIGRTVGWPGPASQRAGLAWSRYTVVDMFARVIQGEPAESAAAWAEGELKSVYEA